MRQFEKKLISLIMPLYNAENYVEEAIQSILDQTYSNFEMVLIDDCSTDNTMEKVTSFKDSRIKIIYNNKNMGIAYSRNIGLEFSSGEYIALLDDDDIALPDRFEKQVMLLTENPDIDIVGGGAIWINDKGASISDMLPVLNNPKRLRAEILFHNIYWNCEVMFRRKIVEAGYRYEDGYLGMEDYKFWIDLSGIYKMSNVESLVLKHRESMSSETTKVLNQKWDKKQALFESLRKYSFERSGYYLRKEDYDIINHILTERRDNWCKTQEEIDRFREALINIIMIGKRINIDYLPELIETCQVLSLEKTGSRIGKEEFLK